MIGAAWPNVARQAIMELAFKASSKHVGQFNFASKKPWESFAMHDAKGFIRSLQLSVGLCRAEYWTEECIKVPAFSRDIHVSDDQTLQE